MFGDPSVARAERCRLAGRNNHYGYDNSNLAVSAGWLHLANAILAISHAKLTHVSFIARFKFAWAAGKTLRPERETGWAFWPERQPWRRNLNLNTGPSGSASLQRRAGAEAQAP